MTELEERLFKAMWKEYVGDSSLNIKPKWSLQRMGHEHNFDIRKTDGFY